MRSRPKVTPGAPPDEARRRWASGPLARPEGMHRLHPIWLLRWVYIGRMALASGVLIGAFLTWGEAAPRETFVVTLVFLSVLAMTGWGAWQTEVRGRVPSRTLLYAQMVFDACAITAIVHVTGGASSVFDALYIPVIGMAAVLLPAPGVALIGGLSAILYLADAVWSQQIYTLSGTVILKIGLFASVAAIAGLLGDRLRRTGMALGEVESELRRLRIDTSEILASVTSGVMTVDSEERMAYLNPAGEALLGLDPGRWTGVPVLDEVARVAPDLASLLRDSLSDGASRYRQTAEAVRDEERLVLGVTAAVRDTEGDGRAVTAIFQDITDQERLRELNRRNERLEAVAGLAASMAHEIKNPLASIRSAVEQFTSPRLDDADRASLTRMVVRESERLSRLLSDFIDFARVRVARRERVDLRALVREAAAVVEQHPAAEERGVRIAVELPERLVPLMADADVLHRAVLNLALNAAQFSPEGSTVQVTLEDFRGVQGQPWDPGRTRMGIDEPVCIRVRDHGPGIPEEDAERVFDPFFTTRREGSGLGLAMVHRAVEAHHGAIVIERPGDGGTEFVLYLPGELSGADALEVENV